MARLQRARARAGRGREHAAARAGEVPGDLHVEPRRVRDGASGRSPRPGGRGRRGAQGGRPDRVGDDRQGRRQSSRRPTSGTRSSGRRASARRSLQHGIRIITCENCAADVLDEGRRDLPTADLPGAHAVGGGARPAVPLHLEPVAQPRGDAARPRHGQRRVRTREGAQGGAAPVHPDRREHLRSARGGDRAQPPRAVPRHGDQVARLLPCHPRRRFHRLGRGRRPRARGRAGATPAAIRRGGPARGR